LVIIFNTFVIYSLFNQINSRILDDSFNIFKDIQKNLWFLPIEIIEFGLHAIIIQLTRGVFKVSRYGLTGYQWGIWIGFGVITFGVSIIAKFCLSKMVLLLKLHKWKRRTFLRTTSFAY